MFRDALCALLDLVVPPRDTDKVVRELTLEELMSLADGELPYHDEGVRALVWELKYFANPVAAKLAGAVVAEELLALAQDEIGKPLLIPVPMHKTRRRQRGHNQTELLCKAALKEIGENVFEYRKDLLVRAADTPTQQGLERAKRLRNVQNAMKVTQPKLVGGRVCIIVDDVTTTGATFAEAKRALKEARARRIHCVALARS